MVDVPNVIGKTQVMQSTKLEDLKLSVEIKEKETDRENENGIVLEQSISDKKVEEGTAITIYCR